MLYKSYTSSVLCCRRGWWVSHPNLWLLLKWCLSERWISRHWTKFSWERDWTIFWELEQTLLDMECRPWFLQGKVDTESREQIELICFTINRTKTMCAPNRIRSQCYMSLKIVFYATFFFLFVLLMPIFELNHYQMKRLVVDPNKIQLARLSKELYAA